VASRFDELGTEPAFVEELKDYRLAFTPLVDSHHFHNHAHFPASGAESTRPRMLRIQKELSSLTTSLPLGIHSSIFVAVDETESDYLRFMILPSPGKASFPQQFSPSSEVSLIVCWDFQTHHTDLHRFCSI
jgi:hypothetical protein